MQVLEKVAKSIGRNYGVTLKFKGSQAYTDGKTIVVPALPESLSEEDAHVIRGYCDHETGHVKYTEIEVMKNAIEIGGAKLKNMVNLLEDFRIENLLATEYPGAKYNMNETAKSLLADTDVNHIMGKLWIEGRRRVCGYELDGPCYYDEVAKAFGKDIFDRIKACKDAREILELAKEMVDAYEAPEPETPEVGIPSADADEEVPGDGGDGTGEGKEQADEQTDTDKANGEDEQDDDADDTVADGMGDGEGEGEGEDEEDGQGDGDGEDADDQADDTTGKGKGEAADGDDDTDTDDAVDEDDPKGTDEPYEGRSHGSHEDKEKDDLEDWDDPIDKLKEELERRHKEAVEAGEYLVYDTSKDEIQTVKHHNPRTYALLKNSLGSLNTIKGKIKNLFLTRTASKWLADQERGKVNGRSLAKVKSGYKNVFKTKWQSQDADTAISFLVDFSGSMVYAGSGRRIKNAMRAVVMFLETLAVTKIKSEVLGYTTKNMMFHGAGYEYGRVEPLLTYVFKAFDEPFNAKVKGRVGAYKGLGTYENCDSESVLVAHGRLAQRPEKRKILFVLTDGAVCNHGNTVKGSNHLRETIKKIEKAGRVDVICIALGTKGAEDYYSNVIYIPDSVADEFPSIMLESLRKILKV